MAARAYAKVSHRTAGAIGAVVARFVHTEEVTGSNPVSPTITTRSSREKIPSPACFLVEPAGPGRGSGPAGRLAQTDVHVVGLPVVERHAHPPVAAGLGLLG